ncbi:ABC transporter substrate-binding protein [Gloeocapsopsis sp. IPPAS B-1203]|uniref:ABC transporter substrate-binding protein n=1 Tax=Gloeocapsopsis sp. IPPAS B-1203 TaxID=2049454 RepID=UPI0025A0A14E|nr:ABC transporter substrate-binding protein [Gloeocapsopsis sp. IPPAS B-1203]
MVTTSMMKRASYRFIKLFLLAAFSFLFLTACSSPVIQNSHLSLNPSAECRVIQHELGETCIPLNPQRIIALDPNITLDPLIALGIKPIGYGSYNFGEEESLFGVSLDDLAGATMVGHPNQASLEKILLLKPDLILTSQYNNQFQLLSAIAPTVLVPLPNLEKPKDEAFFKENLRYVAKIFGEEAKAEEIINQYQQRIDELQQRLGNQLEQIEVSIIFHDGQGLVYTPARNYDATADVLVDLGIRYKLPPLGAPISIESFDEYNTDILFIMNAERRSLSYYTQHPLFSHLKAVKNNRLYLVPPERWDSRGILGANQILDDLFKYLLEDT